MGQGGTELLGAVPPVPCFSCLSLLFYVINYIHPPGEHQEPSPTPQHTTKEVRGARRPSSKHQPTPSRCHVIDTRCLPPTMTTMMPNITHDEA